jgi:hypothetical protein
MSDNVTYASFIANFPEFNSEPPPVFNLLKKTSLSFFSGTQWDSNRDDVINLYIAHQFQLKTVAKKTSNGLVKSIQIEDEGTLQFNDLSSQTSLNFLESLKRTWYGSLLADLIRQMSYENLALNVPQAGTLAGSPNLLRGLMVY